MNNKIGFIYEGGLKNNLDNNSANKNIFDRGFKGFN